MSRVCTQIGFGRELAKFGSRQQNRLLLVVSGGTSFTVTQEATGSAHPMCAFRVARINNQNGSRLWEVADAPATTAYLVKVGEDVVLAHVAPGGVAGITSLTLLTSDMGSRVRVRARDHVLDEAAKFLGLQVKREAAAPKPKASEPTVVKAADRIRKLSAADTGHRSVVVRKVRVEARDPKVTEIMCRRRLMVETAEGRTFEGVPMLESESEWRKLPPNTKVVIVGHVREGQGFNPSQAFIVKAKGGKKLRKDDLGAATLAKPRAVSPASDDTSDVYHEMVTVHHHNSNSVLIARRYQSKVHLREDRLTGKIPAGTHVMALDWADGSHVLLGQIEQNCGLTDKGHCRILQVTQKAA